MQSTDPFSYLDSDSIAHIIPHVDPLDIIVLQRVSRAWRELLNSEWIARHALVTHFPYSSETAGFREGGARGVTLDFRRCVYRYHTRRLGLPTSVRHMVLEPSLGVAEWGTTGGECSWWGEGGQG